MRLEGRAAIVTGGGRGIGRAVALALAGEGANVVVSARTCEEIEAVAAEIQQTGRAAMAVQADLTQSADAERVVAETVSKFGRVDILVNNAGGVPSEVYTAGGAPRMAPVLWEIPESTWDCVIAANLKTAFLCLKAVMPGMIAGRGGDIVNIVSQAGRVPYPVEGSYTTAKHAVMALTRTAALQASPYGIRVNAVSPGLIDTPGQRRLLSAMGAEESFPFMHPASYVGAAVLYVLCDAPPTMTGQSLDLFTTPVGSDGMVRVMLDRRGRDQMAGP